MKTNPLLLALVLGLGGACAGLASDKTTANPEPKPAAVQNNGKKVKAQPGPHTENVALTGTYIKREVRRNGQITDGPSPVLVLDQKTIQNSGASDLRQLLVRQGVNR